MKTLRALLLGSAAVVAASTGANAADMMMDVKAPREPVYRCDITGFIELPGTDICFKVGGFAALTLYAYEDQWDPAVGAAYGIVPDGHTLNDTFGMYGYGRINFDARTSTEYGTVRAFVELQAYDNDTRTGGSADLRHAFVQFGNWTFGKTWSTFLHLDSSPVYSDFVTVTGDNYIRRNQIRYTQSFGSGFTLMVALEDQEYDYPYAMNAQGVYFTPPGANFVVNDRSSMPDVVAAIRFEGDWGNAQLSGAVHQNEFREVNGAGMAPAPLPGNQTDDEFGWAVLFGTYIDTPMTGEGDYFTFKAMYTDGATQYNQDNFLGSANPVWGLCNWLVPALGGCIVDTVTTWSVLASYTHNWSPTIASTFGAGYQNVDAPLTRLDLFTFSGASNFEMDTYEFFGNVSWTPVNNLTFLFDLHYGHVDFNGAGTFLGVFDPFFANPFAKDDEGAFGFGIDITRTF
ncbi:DcaP family trimeric outer membrane transporter [Microbaculum marinum]|uniref:Porin n=1 Tax=Microbaculum marinum TaxID=1764581 RepID=A0AAW9RXP2_9HYPH